MKLKNMNKNGFTLVELLAVIAILAILVVILVPNFVDMFKESKSNVFITEVQTLMKQAQQDWMLGGGGAQQYKTGDFSLEGKSESVEYYLVMNVDGLFTTVVVSNDDACLEAESYTDTETGKLVGVKMADLDPTVATHHKYYEKGDNNKADPYNICRCKNEIFKDGNSSLCE